MNSAVLWRTIKQLKIYNRNPDAASRLQAEAAEILGMAKEIERLTTDTPPGTPAKGLE
jgi:hypothetical protein